jgi:hypothetical protein
MASLMNKTMKHENFTIGLEFETGSGKWRCTDIGTRVIVAIRIDQVSVRRHDHENTQTIETVTNDQTWVHGPPYAVSETVFDEYDMSGCYIEPEVAK